MQQCGCISQLFHNCDNQIRKQLKERKSLFWLMALEVLVYGWLTPVL
jgi:hypothetical protein